LLILNFTVLGIRKNNNYMKNNHKYCHNYYLPMLNAAGFC